MIVEIRGVDYEKMEKMPHFLERLDLGELRGFNKKIQIGVDTGEARWVNTHRTVFGADGVRVFLREPGELCVTIEGSRNWILVIFGGLLTEFDIPLNLLLHLLEEEK